MLIETLAQPTFSELVLHELQNRGHGGLSFLLLTASKPGFQLG